MSNVMLNIFVRVIKKRIAAGEDLEDILAEYTNLSEEDKQQIRDKIKGSDKNGQRKDI